jgi:hypothetical protein
VDLGVPGTKEATDFVVGDDPWDEDDYHKTEGWIVNQVFGVLKQWYRDPADQNFEVLLHAFEGMATLERSWRPGAGGRGRVIWSLLTGGPRGELLPIFQNGFADRGARRLLRRLHEAFAGHPTDKAAAKWRSYETWWRELSNTFDLDIATTNYDRLIEEAMPSVDQGFRSVSGEDVQRFTPMDFRGPGHRLAHLHGSVNFGYRPLSGDHNRFAFRDGFHDLYRFDDPKRARDSWGARSNPTAQSGEELIVAPLITGLQKPDKVLAAEPYHSYYRYLGNWLEATPRLLVIGYGFGDVHLNSLLARLTSWHGDTRRVIVITWIPESEWVLNHHSNHYRHEEGMVVARWSEEPEWWFNKMSFYDPVWTSQNKRCRVYHIGLQSTIDMHLPEIIEFLKQA